MKRRFEWRAGRRVCIATRSAVMRAALAAGLMAAAATAGHAQPPASAMAKPTRIILLGTAGGPGSQVARSQPASLLVVDGRPYLIDSGDGVVRQLELAGYQPHDVPAIFLTHLHFDHTAGLAAFLAFDWYSPPAEPVPILGPPGTTLLTQDAITYDHIAEDIFTPELPAPKPLAGLYKPHDVDVSSPTVIFSDGRVRVLAVPNSHYVTMKPTRRAYGLDRSYSYRFEAPDRTVVFTGDTGPSEAVVALARHADVLVSEVINVDSVMAEIRRGARPGADLRPLIQHMQKEHLSPEEVGRIAARAEVKMVVLTHIVSGPEDADSAAVYIAGVRKFFSGPVVGRPRPRQPIAAPLRPAVRSATRGRAEADGSAARTRTG